MEAFKLEVFKISFEYLSYYNRTILVKSVSFTALVYKALIDSAAAQIPSGLSAVSGDTARENVDREG